MGKLLDNSGARRVGRGGAFREMCGYHLCPQLLGNSVIPFVAGPYKAADVATMGVNHPHRNEVTLQDVSLLAVVLCAPSGELSTSGPSQ